MNRNATIRLSIAALGICLFSTIGYSQGDNTMDAMVNLGCIESTNVTGSVPNDQARGIPEDILWDPSTKDWKTQSNWHEYGLPYNSTAADVTRENPLWWQVTWPIAKNCGSREFAYKDLWRAVEKGELG